MADDDGFIPNDEWSDNGEEEHDQFPVDHEDEEMPGFSKASSAAKTIFVTQQFRFFEDDYQIVQSIGEPGQFGIAYECYIKRDPFQTRRCVKEINKARFHHIGADARNDILHTMQNEIAILKKVDHPNIVKLFDVYEDRHRLHLVMEFLPGGELFARICEKESFTEKEAVTILKQILEALDHMHDRNILHLDLKPDNILFVDKSENSPIKLIDFGMARVVPRLAKLKDRVGTPNYMAPEVFDGNYSKAADIWSVGIIGFCMLFGFPPFYVDEEDIHLDEHKSLELKIKAGFEPLVKDGFGAWFPADIAVSDHCRYLIGKMLEMDVKKRWTTKECLSSVWIRSMESASEKTLPPIVRDALNKFHSTSKFKVAISNMFTHQIDPDHIESIRVFFDELDANKDGAISLKEFKDGMMNKFNTTLSDQQLEQIFANVDLDDDREITFKELMTITAHRMLIDEDERLYQAFQDLDKDGNGLISEQELKQAINEYERKANDPSGTSKQHVRQSTIVLKRFQSAFHGADRNNDGQIDYEEFLRMLHPEFADENLTLDEFKSNVADSGGGRVRATGFNVDYGLAQPSEYMEIKPSPRSAPMDSDHLQQFPSTKQMKTLTLGLGAFGARKSQKNVTDEESKQMQEKLERQKAEMERLEQENAKLKERLDESERLREEIRSKYETEMFEKFRQQSHDMKTMKDEWKDRQTEAEKMSAAFQQRLSEKDKQIHEKDVLIANLNMLLDKRNSEIEDLKQQLQQKKKDNKNLETMLEHAIDSKMKSLVRSQEEIQKLKMMLSNTGRHNDDSLLSPQTAYNSSSNDSADKPKRKKKARHLSHLIGD
eukprot:CAMPEP_0197049350 /NCGR_PEP_ID=MMETSP1384-20130603/24512_1 /TAXON_ID=29189 /ORGANISM="Ammonia sp." /LENGTH=829 /DNA_ID=CAMNT_0042481615 /DNA_START=70 /DNA_END=2559 /DNA_ORIENTATION=-